MDTGSFDKLVNRIIDKKYKIESAVGVGGMAYVLKAKDLTDGKDVAIKFLSDEFKDDERAVKRFINESKTISMLDHENIVKVYDVVINSERKYIVMEFIDGITLKDYIDKIGTLSWKEAIHYVSQVLSALDHAHKKLVIHRDIKPQNIMLLPDGTVKVTDFGIAKQPGAESITMTDKAIGTVNYISPEQASGAEIDTRTDIYSVGVMLYEMVTGRLPFIADSPVAVAMMQVSNEPLSPREINPQIPIGLEQIILKAMQKNADERFSGAAAMLKALKYFAKNPDIVFAGSVTDTGATGAKLKKSDYEDEEKKEERRKKQRRGSRSMFPIVSGIACAAIIVLVVATSSFWWPILSGLFGANGDIDSVVDKGSETINDFLGGGVNSETISVMSFVDKVYSDELVAEMNENGYSVEMIKPMKDGTKDSNVVIKQEPEAGAPRLKPADGKLIPITLYVNMSEDEMYMPDCILKSEASAKQLISKELTDKLGLDNTDSVIVMKYYSHPSYPKGYVISTEPSANQIVKKSDDLKIIVNVSMGKKMPNTTLPVLDGLTLEEAESALNSRGVYVGKIIYEDNPVIPFGTVIRASVSGGETGVIMVKGGETVAKDITTVDLWVSRGDGTGIVVPEQLPTDTPVTDEPEQVPSENPVVTPSQPTVIPENPPAPPSNPTQPVIPSNPGGTIDISNIPDAPTQPLPPPSETVPVQQPASVETGADNNTDAPSADANRNEGESDISNLLDMRG